MDRLVMQQLHKSILAARLQLAGISLPHRSRQTARRSESEEVRSLLRRPTPDRTQAEVAGLLQSESVCAALFPVG